VLFNLVENHFKAVQKLKEKKMLPAQESSASDRFRPSVVPLVMVDKIIDELSEDPTVIDPNQKEDLTKQNSTTNLRRFNFHKAANFIISLLAHRNTVNSKKHRKLIIHSAKFKQTIREYEEISMELAPKVQDRIIMIKNNQVTRLII
jgi:hypothetical protein